MSSCINCLFLFLCSNNVKSTVAYGRIQGGIKLQAVMNGPSHTCKSGVLRPPASVTAIYPATAPSLVVPCLNFVKKV